MQSFAVARSSVRAAALARQPLSRSFAVSSGRLSTGAHLVDPEKAAEELEDGKRKSVNGVQDNTVEHAPGWNEKIASESEAIIKGSKSNKGPEELAQETVEHLSKKK